MLYIKIPNIFEMLIKKILKVLVLDLQSMIKTEESGVYKSSTSNQRILFLNDKKLSENFLLM